MKRTGKSQDRSRASRISGELDSRVVAAVPQPPIAWPAFLSGLMLWASFAPIGASFLAWFAPLGWLWVIDRDASPSRRGYLLLYLSGLLFWLPNLQGIRLAFWPLIFGWMALAVYLAVYIPFCVGIARTLRHTWRWPLMLAAPVAWVGMEVARCFIITGYAASQLGHSQAHHPMLIQIADQLGGYGVSYLIVTVSVALYQLVIGYRRGQMRSAIVPAGVSCALLVIALGYGWWRLNEADVLRANRPPLLKVSLLQENTPTVFDSNEARIRSAWGRYLDLTRESAQQHGVVDLVVWPESTFTAGVPWTQVNVTDKLPDELLRENVTLETLEYHRTRLVEQFEIKIARVLAAARNESLQEPPTAATRERPYLLVGCDALIIGGEKVERYNSAILIDPSGNYQDRYDKIHLVMFGEYIPLGPVLKFLADAFQLGSVQPGKDVKAFDVAGARIAPNICFESMLPEFASWQVRRLTAAGRTPDVLINVTNDSWFRGSSILDHHLACSIFCAVENRRPLLAAANTGLSAEIDGSGRVLQVSPRLDKAIILAEPRADARGGLVQLAGYPPAWLCCLVSSIALIYSIISRFRTRPIDTKAVAD